MKRKQVSEARDSPIERDYLRRLLEERRRDLAREVRTMIRDVRDVSEKRSHVSSDEGFAVSDVADDLETALIQLKSDMLAKVETALTLIEDEQYGLCRECGRQIGFKRLRALPFALRCTECESVREQQTTYVRQPYQVSRSNE